MSLISFDQQAQDEEFGIRLKDAEVIDHPTSLREFEAGFPDDYSCARWLSAKRWPDGLRCPACGHGKGFELELGVLTYRRAGCRKQTVAFIDHLDLGRHRPDTAYHQPNTSQPDKMAA